MKGVLTFTSSWQSPVYPPVPLLHHQLNMIAKVVLISIGTTSVPGILGKGVAFPEEPKWGWFKLLECWLIFNFGFFVLRLYSWRLLSIWMTQGLKSSRVAGMGMPMSAFLSSSWSPWQSLEIFICSERLRWEIILSSLCRYSSISSKVLKCAFKVAWKAAKSSYRREFLCLKSENQSTSNPSFKYLPK